VPLLPVADPALPGAHQRTLLDRIDLHIEAPALSLTELRSDKPGESSAALRTRVGKRPECQRTRFAGSRTAAQTLA